MRSLCCAHLERRNRLDRNWGGRRRHFWWVNDIKCRYGNHERKRQTVHVVIWVETWEEVDPQTAVCVRAAKLLSA